MNCRGRIHPTRNNGRHKCRPYNRKFYTMNLKKILNKEQKRKWEELKREILEANKSLPKKGLVIETFGNVSGILRFKKISLIVIKPSGVNYDLLKIEDLVTVGLNGKKLDGKLKPSVDTSHHLHIYQNLEEIRAVVHTHSLYATAWACTGKPIPVYNTTQADKFGGEIPCAPYADNQNNHIGKSIVKYRKEEVPAILLEKHGAFIFGTNAKKSVETASELEFVAKVAFNYLQLCQALKVIPKEMDKKEVKIWRKRHLPGGDYGQQV